jgi:hypothetical protein
MRVQQMVAAVAILFGALSVAPVRAQMDCPHPMDATVQALKDCVQHAADMGMIDNSGVAGSLLSKLDAAQAAVDHNAPATAVNILRAFTLEVQAQAGKHIDASHAEHMVMHAQMVIDALST